VAPADAQPCGPGEGHQPTAWVETRRGGLPETLHRVSVAVADGSGALVAATGDPHRRTFWRSAAKPFQLLPFVACGGAAAYGFGRRELALMAASHNGESRHRALAAAILAAAGLEESDLLCGTHLPEAEPAWRELAARGGAPTPLWNNCSGKHAGMLAHCRHRGWPVFDYRRPDHPLQVEIAALVARTTGERPGAIRVGVDGCGVPAFHLSLAGMASAYARLVGGGMPEEWRQAASAIVDAMASEAWYLAGTGRLCTRLHEVSGTRVIAKAGAAGIFCAGLRERGWGLALKVEDGSGRIAGVALLEALRQLEVLAEPDLAALAPFTAGELRNHAGTPVGEAAARFGLAPFAGRI
jgi:L-asparaginase II